MNAIKKDDEVILIAGKDKGKRGRVLRVVTRAVGYGRDDTKKQLHKYYLVEGLNLVKKHVKPNPDKGERGGIREQEALVHGSNVMIYNPITQKRDRVGIRIASDGKKNRCFKSNGEIIGN